MTKPKLGKTKTIKDRTIYVYLPNLGVVRDWKSRAEKAGISISKLIMERVEDSIRKEEGEEGYLSRLELAERLRAAEDRLKKLQAENRMFRKLAENLDRELKRYRTKPFLEKGFEGVRKFDRDLIDLLKKGRPCSEDEIFTHLDIDPSDSGFVSSSGDKSRRKFLRSA